MKNNYPSLLSLQAKQKCEINPGAASNVEDGLNNSVVNTFNWKVVSVHVFSIPCSSDCIVLRMI